jgi:hypothetical protein
MLMACDATCTPSIQYTTPVLLQSIRYRCGAPKYADPRSVSIAVDQFVRASSVVPPGDPVLKIAQGAVFRSVPKPTCWLVFAWKVATNSNDPLGP